MENEEGDVSPSAANTGEAEQKKLTAVPEEGDPGSAGNPVDSAVLATDPAQA